MTKQRIDWSSDPELAQLRDDFIGSLKHRLAQVKQMQKTQAPDVDGAVELSHKLGGIAETYGFEALTTICTAIEDWLEKDSKPDTIRFREALELLEAALLSAAQTRANSTELAQDKRLAWLISAGGSSRAGSKT
jgi:HPt (histidine-containing phosphotransfer) domain-containing protein